MVSIDVTPADLQIVKKILGHHVPEYEVRGFGSRILGKAAKTSDLDLAVMAAKPLDTMLKIDLKEAFSEQDLKKALRIMAKERKYLDLELRYRLRHLERLKLARKESVKTHEVHVELLDLMKQVIVYSSNIAKTTLATTGKAGQLVD